MSIVLLDITNLLYNMFDDFKEYETCVKKSDWQKYKNKVSKKQDQFSKYFQENNLIFKETYNLDNRWLKGKTIKFLIKMFAMTLLLLCLIIDFYNNSIIKLLHIYVYSLIYYFLFYLTKFDFKQNNIRFNNKALENIYIFFLTIPNTILILIKHIIISSSIGYYNRKDIIKYLFITFFQTCANSEFDKSYTQKFISFIKNLKIECNFLPDEYIFGLILAAFIIIYFTIILLKRKNDFKYTLNIINCSGLKFQFYIISTLYMISLFYAQLNEIDEIKITLICNFHHLLFTITNKLFFDNYKQKLS